MRTFHAFGKGNDCGRITQVDYNVAYDILKSYGSIPLDGLGTDTAFLCNFATPVPDPRIDASVYEEAWNRFESIIDTLPRGESFEITGTSHVHLETASPANGNNGLASTSSENDTERLDAWILKQ